MISPGKEKTKRIRFVCFSCGTDITLTKEDPNIKNGGLECPLCGKRMIKQQMETKGSVICKGC